MELIDAPERVREILQNYSNDNFERVSLTTQSIELADKYILEKVVGKTSIEDCRHIALATINKVDVLVSWNFKHIVNLKSGYGMIEIRSPKDLINYGNE